MLIGKTYIDTHIKCLGLPVAGYASTQPRRETVDISRSSSTIVVHIACQTGFVGWVTNKEHTLHSGEVRACELRHGINCSCCTLRVTLKNNAFIWVRPKGACDFVDNVAGAKCRVLVETSGINGAVNLSTRERGCDSRIHGSEAGGWSLRLAGAARVDDCVGWAAGRYGALGFFHGSSEGHCKEWEDGEKSRGMHCEERTSSERLDMK